MIKMSDVLNKQLPKIKGAYLIIGMPEDGQDYDFSRDGCALTGGLACDVVEVDCLVGRNNEDGNFELLNEFRANVSGNVLDHYHNGVEYTQNERGDWVSENEGV